MAFQESQFVKQITELYDQISKLESLKHCKKVDTLFGQLMTICSTTDTNIDVTKMSQEVQDMRSNLIKLHSEASGYFEKHFSNIFGSLEDNPLDHIDLYPSYTKFLDLTKFEFELLTQHTTHTPTKIAFIGSGPMPLSSIILAKFHLPKATFYNIDIDSEANALASRLVSRDPDLSHRMIFHTIDLLDMTKEILGECNVIFLAALVGLDKEEKVKAIEHLEKHMAPGSLLMLRSAHGRKAFIYPTLDTCDLKGFEVLTIHHLMTYELNTVVIARKLDTQTMTVMNTQVPNGHM